MPQFKVKLDVEISRQPCGRGYYGGSGGLDTSVNMSHTHTHSGAKVEHTPLSGADLDNKHPDAIMKGLSS